MKISANSVDDYLSKLPPDRKPVLEGLRQAVTGNLPDGFTECISYDMIGYVVPHTRYPNGYHCKPELPLPFMNLASQKNYVAVHHMGIYASPELLDWFVGEFPKHCKRKLDMGKSCIRFKKMDDVPYQLIGELAGKMSVADWIGLYESQVKR